MKKSFKILVVLAPLLIILLIILTIFLSLSLMKESIIENKIDEANYCEKDSDCVDAGSKCPFGCYNYVNKDEVDQIKELIEGYNSKCVYSCLSCPSVICNNSKCREVCE